MMRRSLALAIALAIGGACTISDFAYADLIAHYDMEEAGGALTDQAGGQTAGPADAGHQYGLAGPAGFGNAVGLNDNGSWQLSEADSAELRNLANDFTVAAWIYLDSALADGKTGANPTLNRIIGDDVAWDADGWAFGVFNNGNLRFTKNGVVDQDLGSMDVASDQWVHVAATVSGTSGTTFYVNGGVVGNHANAADVNTGLGNNGMDDPYGLGRSYGNGEAQWFAGRMDEIRVYNTVLNGDEIGRLVPEPTTLGLLGMGLAAATLGVGRRRRGNA